MMHVDVDPDLTELSRWLAHETLRLCQIPSVTGDEAALADDLEARLRRLADAQPLAVTRLGNTVLVRRARRPGRPLVGLFGHMDTVKPSAQQPLRIDEAAGRVYGCGTSDMKGGLAVMLRLLAEADALPYDLLCVFYDKEEGPAADSGILPLCQPGAGTASPLGDLDLALCLEPTDGEIHAGCIGGLQALVTARGRRAHSARPWQGENAIYAALPLLARLRDSTRREVMVGGLPFYEVLTATTAATANSRNVVPDRFVLNLNYRFAPNKELGVARAELFDFIGPGYDVEIVDEAPPGAVRLDAPLLRDWIGRTGLSVAAKQAWTDVARLTALGLCAVNFGPGDTAEAHQANESVSVAALVRGYRLLREIAR
jgi:succinyl-diaminopimelate desuccinylase